MVPSQYHNQITRKLILSVDQPTDEFTAEWLIRRQGLEEVGHAKVLSSLPCCFLAALSEQLPSTVPFCLNAAALPQA